MTSADIPWLVSLILGILALGGGVIARDRYVLSLISKNHNETIDKLSEAISLVHKRIDAVKDEYVRQTDLDRHVKHLDDSVRDLKHELRSSSEQTNQRLDSLLSHFTTGVPITHRSVRRHPAVANSEEDDVN